MMPSNPEANWQDDNCVARPDFDRVRRRGVPEVILAERKTTEQVLAIVRQFLASEGRAILSRVPEALERRLREEFVGQATLEWYSHCCGAVLRRPDVTRANSGGRVAILTAGTSDIPRAEEAALVCREMGCRVFAVYDVGVAGLHRLFEPLDCVVNKERVDVIVVAAGMDGALPSVVSGMVPLPVIGLPTSVGYGLGGEGVAALLCMLQTCAPGLAVVNIDNGIGAGAVAALIANGAAAARRKVEQA